MVQSHDSIFQAAKDNSVVVVIASEAKQSIFSLRPYGLLRCAPLVGWDAKSSRCDLGCVGTEIFFGKTEIKLDSPVNKPPDGQITRLSRSSRGAEIPDFLLAVQRHWHAAPKARKVCRRGRLLRDRHVKQSASPAAWFG